MRSVALAGCLAFVTSLVLNQSPSLTTDAATALAKDKAGIIQAAFLFGWAELVLIRAASLGAISTTFAEYFTRVLGHDPSVEPYAG